MALKNPGETEGHHQKHVVPWFSWPLFRPATLLETAMGTAACGAKAILRPPREQAWEKRGKFGKIILSMEVLVGNLWPWSFRKKNMELNWSRSRKPCLMTRGHYKLDLGLGWWMQHVKAAAVFRSNCCHQTVAISYSSTLLWMQCPKDNIDNMEHMTPDQCSTSQF